MSAPRGPGLLPAVGAVLLAAASVLHVAWGAGASWPARDRRELADLVAGTDELPGPVACFTVAGLLATAAGLVAGGPGGAAGRAARGAVAGALAVRGAAGIAGVTGRLVPWQPSARFVERDRRLYGPLCAVIAVLVAAGVRGGRRRPRAVR